MGLSQLNEPGHLFIVISYLSGLISVVFLWLGGGLEKFKEKSLNTS